VKLRLVIEFDPEVQRWSAVFPELPGCASAGDTEEEAVANAKEALALWFEPTDVPLEGVLVDRLAGPFEPLEADWKERVRQSATK
jgi:predicted RNase H-like HicB family nuclease